LKKKAGPNVIRELEGAFAGARGVRWRDGEKSDVSKPKEHGSGEMDETVRTAGDSGRKIMSLLATPQEATKGVREAMSSSRWPMGYLKIGLNGRVEQLLWNRAAAAQGLEGLGVVQRHVPMVEQEHHQTSDMLDSEDGGDGLEVADLSKPKVMEQEIVLTSRGETWENPLD